MRQANQIMYPNNQYLPTTTYQIPHIQRSPTETYEQSVLPKIVIDNKMRILKASFYAFLFYCLTAPSVIEMTSNYIPNFLTKRLAHTILFGFLYLLLNCN